MNFQGRDMTDDPFHRAHVLGMIRYAFSPGHPLYVGHAVMRECIADPDLCELVADRHIVETPMIR